MRIRSIKPEFWSSQSNGRLTRNARLIFIGLWTVADNFGRFRAEPRVLAGSILPYDRDAVAVVRKALAELLSEGKIELYEYERSTFGAIPAFAEHQWMKTRGKPVHPDPRDPASILIDGQAFDRQQDRQIRLDEGLRDKDQGSGVKGQGSGVAQKDRSPPPRPGGSVEKQKKPKPPEQPELPAIPPPPPPPPRALSRQEEAADLYRETRITVLEELGLPPSEDESFNPGFLNLALGPILDAVEPHASAKSSGFERLLDLWFRQSWAADKAPPFPMRMFLSCCPTKPSTDGKPPRPGLIDRMIAGE